MSLIHPPADGLHHAREDSPRVGVESEADALPRPEVLQAVLAQVGDHPPLVPVDAGQHRGAHMHVRAFPELDVGDVAVGRGVDARPFQVEPGLGELRLPETQPGSSIMPGKVNPVIIESLLMVIARVYGNDTTVVVSGQAGSLFELNVMMPVAGFAMLESITLLAAAARNFSERCVEGLQATDRGPELVERSPMLATALNPVIGYDEAAKLAKESMRTGRSIRQLARGRGVSERELNRVLDLGKMTRPGLEGPGGGG